MFTKETLFQIGVQLTVCDLEKKANSRYGLSSYKLWNALNSIAEKGAEWNIDGFRGSNTMDALFANMGPNIASLAKATDEAERVNQPTQLIKGMTQVVPFLSLSFYYCYKHGRYSVYMV